MPKGTKLKYGSYHLYPIWEKFCQNVVNAFGNNEQRTLIRAWELTQNLPPTPDKKERQRRYNRASEWMQKPEIKGRCEEIEREFFNIEVVPKEHLVKRHSKVIDGDPLITMKEDEESGQYVYRRLNEIPRNWRKLVTPMIYRGRMIYVLDKKYAEQQLIALQGYETGKTVNVNANGRMFSGIRIGYGDDED